MRLVPVLLTSVLVLVGCGSGAVGGGSDDAEKLSRHYVEAINARDGEGVCGLMTEAARAELSAPDSNMPCERSVPGMIGYVEDAGMPEFLRLRLNDVQSGATEGEYSGIRLSLEARRRSTSGSQAFESCGFEDTVWLTREGDELRIAKVSMALWVAFGATNVPGDVLTPPGLDASNDEEVVLDCTPEKGQQPDPNAPLQSPDGVAALLDRESDQVSDVRCFEANGSDGYDVICTYFDATMGERMKTGYRFGPNSTLSGGGSVPEDMPLPALR